MLNAIRRALLTLNGGKEAARESAVADPARKFPHPKNSELFAYLRRDWLERAHLPSVRAGGDYPFRTHPDLIQRFRSLAPASGVLQDSAYGHAIMANHDGIVFAWAGGMNQIFLRLPQELRQSAIAEAGRYDRTYGEGWIEFLAFGHRYGTQVDSDESLRGWVQVAYGETLKGC
jgi:hypothetical protein